MKKEMELFDFSFLYDIDLENDTYTLLFFDHREVVHGIPLNLLDFIRSGLIDLGCIYGKRILSGGEKYGE